MQRGRVPGSTDDSYDNTMAEALNSLYTEVETDYWTTKTTQHSPPNPTHDTSNAAPRGSFDYIPRDLTTGPTSVPESPSTRELRRRVEEARA